MKDSDRQVEVSRDHSSHPESSTVESIPSGTGESTSDAIGPESTDSQGAGDRTNSSHTHDDENAPPQQEADRSPAKAFAALTTAVNSSRHDLDQLMGFVRVCRDKLLHEADQYRLEGLKPALEGLMRVHDLVWRQVTTMEVGNVRPDAFVVALLNTIEAEFEVLGVEVIRPQPGDEVDLQLMKMIGTVPCPFWRKPDRVAQVSTCGFIRVAESGRDTLQKAAVTVWRR